MYNECDSMDISNNSVKVLYNFKYKTIGHYKVSIKGGEKLFLLEKTNDDWWKVVRHSNQPFYVPSNYVIEIPRAPCRPSLCNAEKFMAAKPKVKKRTIFEDASFSSYQNFPLKNTTVKEDNDDSVFDTDGITKNKKNVSPAVLHCKKKTIITINHTNSGYYSILDIEKCDLNKDQHATQSSSSLRESSRQFEVNSMSSNINRSDTEEQHAPQSPSSIVELDRHNELKSMLFNKIALTSESNNVPNFSEVKNLREHTRNPSIASLGNSTDIEKLNRKIKLGHTSVNFKSKSERNDWAKKKSKRNCIIVENEPDGE